MLVRFLFVGIFNTILGALLMFLFYNVGYMGYWGSSMFSYIISSIFSFFMNKKFTFANKSTIKKTMPLSALELRKLPPLRWKMN